MTNVLNTKVDRKLLTVVLLVMSFTDGLYPCSTMYAVSMPNTVLPAYRSHRVMPSW